MVVKTNLIINFLDLQRNGASGGLNCYFTVHLSFEFTCSCNAYSLHLDLQKKREKKSRHDHSCWFSLFTYLCIVIFRWLVVSTFVLFLFLMLHLLVFESVAGKANQVKCRMTEYDHRFNYSTLWFIHSLFLCSLVSLKQKSRVSSLVSLQKKKWNNFCIHLFSSLFFSLLAATLHKTCFQLSLI